MTLIGRAFRSGGRDRSTPERRDVFTSPGFLGGYDGGAGSITEDNATRIVAIFAAVSLLADTVSTLPVGTFRKGNGIRVPVPAPAWLEEPDPIDPSVTRVDHFSQLMWSLGIDGNSFTLALPDVFTASEVHVLNPQRVEVRRGMAGPIYEVRSAGGGSIQYGPDQIIHIAVARQPGSLRGLSRIAEARTRLGSYAAATQFESRVLTNGVFLSGVLTLPGPSSPETIKEVGDQWATQYGGSNSAGRAGVLSNGATWTVPALSLADLQFMELQRWGVTEIARLFRIPPHLLQDNSPGSVSYASVEAQAIEFEKHTIRPYLERIEAAYKRLVPGKDQFLRFNTNGLLRGDQKSRFEAYQIALNAKFLKRDEARAYEDLAPFTGEDGGFLETPNNNAPGGSTP